MSQPVVAVTVAQPKVRDRKLSLRLLTHPTGAASIVFLALVALVAVFSSLITPQDPFLTDVSNVLAAPSPEHPLGGDSAGRDVLSRLITATTYSVAAGLLVALVASVIGVAGGLMAGYFGGWFDSLASWLTALTMALPAFVVLLAARAAIGPSLWWSMAIFGVVVSPSYFIVTYNAVRAVRNELYVDAARTSGLSTARIIARHILRAVRAPIILLTAGIIAAGIGMVAALDFLGLGDPLTPSWGQMLSEGFYQLTRAPMLVLWPALALALTMIALVLLSAAMRDELEGTSDRGAKKHRAAWSMDGETSDAAVHAVPAQGEALLEVTSLAVAYPAGQEWKTVVKDVNLTVRRGETHGLIGESGSGKSQTAFAVLGLLPRNGRVVAGSITFDGVDITDPRARDSAIRGRRIAYVPQEPMTNLDPSHTVGEQFTDPLRIVLGISRAEAKVRALALLARVGVPDPERVYRSYPHQLSGGMAQRVLIAAAVASGPELLIADEPTTALDVTVQAEVLDLLRELRDESNMSLLLVTHSFGVVADLCDQVSVMQQGVIVETGSTASVFAAPQHEYTQKLFAALPTGALRAPLPGITGAGSLAGKVRS